jgi:heme/copper-type cytochrome/quinol oxidase subunit 3
MSHSNIPLATKRSATGIPTGKLAVWWVVGSEIMIFGGLLASYLMYRLYHVEEFSAAAMHTNTLFGSINTFILLTSSLFIVLAHNAVERGEPEKAFKLIWLTILGGLGFLMVKGVEWSIEISHGYVLGKNMFWNFYYTAAGLHALHVIAGMIIMAIISLDVRKGKFLHRVENMGIYWHFVDIIWIFLFPLLYIAK